MASTPTEKSLAWLLAGAVLATAFLFGGTRLPLGADRYSLYHLVAGLFLALGGLLLIVAEPRRRPGPGWAMAGAALPAWLLVQSLPLPGSLVRWLSPATAAWTERFWPGALVGCAPPALLDDAPGQWLTFALDPVAARQFFFHVAAATVVFLATRTFFAGSPGQRSLLLVVVAIFTAGEAAYGINQWLGLSDRILWATKTAYLDCATGTLVNRNHFAQMLYLGLGCSLTLLAGRRDEDRGRLWAERETAIRVALMLVVALQLAGILASKSRGGLGGALLVLLPSLPLLLRGRAATRTAMAAMLAMVAVPTLLLVGPALMERVGDLPMEWTSAQGRGAVARTSLSLLREFPLFGTGGGSFEWVFATRRPPEILGRYNYAHNDYLQLLIEAGLLGLALALAPVLMGLRGLLRGFRAGRGLKRIPLLLALLAALLHELVDFGFQIPSNAVLFALLAGATLPADPASTAKGPASGGRRWPALVVAAAAVVAAVPAMLHSIVLWPGLETRLPWPRHPDAYHQAANGAWNAWQADRERPEALCRALELESRAQGLRLLSAYLPASQARMTVAGITHGLQGTVIAPEARDQVAALCARARRLNPWNSDIRQRLMRIAPGYRGRGPGHRRRPGRRPPVTGPRPQRDRHPAASRPARAGPGPSA
ncbi:MAG: O-antigen ligase family protein [Acidobacteriota bacterium]|nr:O-antigen ligase family protein [Acidobacteriota bacterium]